MKHGFPLPGEPTYTEVRNEALPPVRDLENELWRMHREMHQAAQSRDGSFNYVFAPLSPRREAAAATDSNRARERAALRKRKST